jgi:hypothetical protein
MASEKKHRPEIARALTEPKLADLISTAYCAPTAAVQQLSRIWRFTGAGHGARTRDLKLGKLALYQLS